MIANTRWAALAAAAFLLVSASAESSESLLAVVQPCAAMTDDAARLRCYDREVARFKAAGEVTGSDPRCSSTSSSSTGPTNTTKPADQFGLTSGEVLRKQSGDEQPRAAKRLTARIVTLSKRPRGYLVLHLDNGQVWEQSEDGPDLHLGPGEPVTIDRGLLGAYWLSAQSGRLAIKVRRTQ